MQKDSLRSLLKQTPITASYTPSSFVKGYVPAVLIESAIHSPVSQFSPKHMSHALSQDMKSSIEKSLADISLYRYPLPPDLVNPNHSISQRPNTLKIFRSKFNAKKEVEILNPSGLDDKKTLTKDQIHRDDNIATVNHLLDRSMKERDRKVKQRGSGSMYINDLWSQGFEKAIMQATKLHNELKEENLRLRKPLVDKLEGIQTLYKKRIKNSAVNLEEFKGLVELKPEQKPEKRPETTQSAMSKTSLFGLRVITEEAEEIKPPKRVTNASVSRIGTSVSGGRKSIGKKAIGDKKGHMKRLSMDLKTEGSPVPKQKGTLRVGTSKQDLMIGLDTCMTEGNYDSRTVLNTMPASSPASKAGSPMSTMTSFSYNKKWAKWAQGSNPAYPGSPGNDRTGTSLFKGYDSLSFSQKVMETTKGRKMNKTQESLVELIEKCDDQLEGSEKYQDLLKEMKKKLQKTRKDNTKEKEIKMDIKERIIRDCRFALNQRDQASKSLY